MPRTATTQEGQDKAARSVISLPGDIVAKVDAAIREDGGEALARLGVTVESMRQGFVHKLLHESLDARNGGK